MNNSELQAQSLKNLEYPQILARLEALTGSALSGKMARELTPHTDREEIQRLLDETEDAVHFTVRRGSPPLSGVADIGPALMRADAGGVLAPGELLHVAGVLRACRRLHGYSADADGDDDNRMAVYIARLREDRMLEERIGHSILSETEIADEASATLLDIRRKITSAQNAIKDRLADMTHTAQYAKALQDAVVTVRGDRYCIPVKVEYRANVPGIVHDTSSSGQTLFIEPSFVVEANNRIRELRVAEQEEIQRILQELTQLVAQESGILRADLELLTVIDFTFAKARLALDMKAVKPRIAEDGAIEILEARHPLLQPHQAVPVTIRLGCTTENGDTPSAMIITGPNTGGKTVTLKTVGLFSLMLQSGLLIPCKERSVMSLYRGVYADIGDEQSIAQNLSTFSAHMRTITEILRCCDDRSLVLFDELGAGTDPTEGAALAMAILECTYQMGATVFATTHYSELKVFAATTRGFINASCEFDVETLRPTYRLLIGVPGKSNAFAISEKLGLDPTVIARAREFLTGEDLRFEDMLSGIERNRAQIEAERQASAELHRAAQQQAQEIEAEREALRQERNQFVSKMRAQAREITDKARASAEKMLTEIRRAALLSGADAVRAAEQAKQQFEQEHDEIDRTVHAGYRDAEEKAEPPQALKPGETVRILSLDCTATVLEPPDGAGKVYLQAGIIKLYRPLQDLKRVASGGGIGSGGNGGTSAARVVGGGGIGSGGSGGRTPAAAKAASVRSEIDVRGMTVAEATERIDRQIDDAILARQPSFTVIHGKGTGALRRGVQDYLRHHSAVKEFRSGEYGEGDLGVTVVYLK